eukprot:g43543.t1
MDVSDYESLGQLIGVPPNQMRRHFETMSFDSFRVKELKVIIEFMQGKGYVGLRKTGRKQELQDNIRTSILRFNRSSGGSSSSNNNSPPSYNGRYQPDHQYGSSYGTGSSVPPSYSSDGHYGGSAYGWRKPEPPAYGRSAYDQAPPWSKPDPYNRSSYSHSSYPNYSSRQSNGGDFEKLLDLHTKGRSPFFSLEGLLGHASLSPYYPAAFDFKITPALYMQLKTPKRPDVPPFAVHAHLLRNVCLMSCLPMCAAGPVRDAHAICCTMSTLSELQGPFAVDAQSTAMPALCVLLQGLFCVHAHLLHADRGHVPWDAHFRITINNYELRPPTPKNKSKLKKKGFEFVKPTDISEYVSYSNTFKVELVGMEDPSTHFECTVLLEIVRIKKSSDVEKEVRFRPVSNTSSSSSSSSSSSLPNPPEQVRECAVCKNRDEDKLLRCSRCRTTWYCGPEHQKIDWPNHEPVCRSPPPVKPPSSPTPPVKKEPLVKKEKDHTEEGLMEGDALLSLACPLSLRRIDRPAKGLKCDHTRCFDLSTFIMYCEQSWIWQCPICDQAIAPSELILDQTLERILKEAPEDCEQVRLKPNGDFEPVKQETMQEREERVCSHLNK